MARLFWLVIVNIVMALLVSGTALATEQPSNNYQGPATIYYNNQPIGSADITFKQQADSIQLSRNAQSLILSHIKPSLTSYYKKKLRPALRKSLKAHSQLAKPDDAKSSSALSLFYSPPDKKLYVFIPPTFQKKQRKEKNQYITTTIYYDSQPIGSANIAFKQRADSIQLSRNAQSLILSHIKPSLTSYYKKKLRPALRKSLKAHSQLAKPDDAKSSSALSLYYSPPDKKLYVFIPPTFEKKQRKEKNQYITATIYYDSQPIGSANIAFKQQADSIQLSRNAQSLILSHIKPSLTSYYKKKLHAALSKSLKAHSQLAKPDDAKSSSALSLFYSPPDKKLYVFIPPTFQKKHNNENIPQMSFAYNGTATIYYNKHPIGSADITFKQQADSIQLSPKARSLILAHTSPSITSYYKKKLHAALSKPLKAHSHLNKPNQAKSSSDISVYYSQSEKKLYVLAPKSTQIKQMDTPTQPTFSIFRRYKGEVALYIDTTPIGSADIEFKEKTDSITLSKEAQSIILSHISPSLAPDYKKRLQASLGKPLKAHSHLAKPDEAKSSNAVSFYYTPLEKKLYVFIPPKFQKQKTNEKTQHTSATIVYKGLATIYYDNHPIGSADIEFKEKTDSITLSKEAQSIILSHISPSLAPIYKKKLPPSLNKLLKAHSHLDKPDQARSPHAMSVYYSALDKQLYIFIPSTFQKKDKIDTPTTKTHNKVQSANEKKPMPQTNSANVTMTTGYVPPGFENITNDYQGIATLYYGKKEIGAADIYFNDTRDVVSLSDEAQSIIMMNITDSVIPDHVEEVRDALALPLAAHSRLTEFYLARSPNQVTVYYSYLNMQLYVFIPNKFMKDKGKDYRYDPEYNYKINYSPSLKSSLNFSYEHYNTQHLIWQSTGGINAGNANIKYDVNGQIQGKFNDLYAQYLSHGYTVKLGYQESTHRNIIAPSGNIWGLSLVENPKMINKAFYQAYQAPLSISLTQPYYVTISYRGRTLFSGTLPQGDNIIDTSNFPKGSYSIDIQKRDLISGNITTESQLFYGQSGKYNWLYSGFELDIGEESEYFNSIDDERTPYFRISNGYKFYDGEVDLSYIHGEHLNFVGVDYDHISTSTLDYSASAYLSTLFDWYFSGSASYIHGPYRYQTYVRNGYQNNDYKSGRQHDIGGSFAYKQEDWELNVNARISDDDNYSISTSVVKNIDIDAIPMRLGLSNNYSDSGVSTIVSLQLPFDYNGIKGNGSITVRDNGNVDLGIGGAIRKNDYFISQNLSLGSGGDGASYSYTNAGYKNDYAELDGDLTITKDNSSIYTSSAGVTVKTNLLATKDGVLFSKDKPHTGYFVKLPVVNDNESFYFDIENQYYPQGTSLYIPKPSYSNNSILISVNTLDYDLDYPNKETFMLPDNIISLRPTILEACLVTFTPDIDGMFTIVGREEEFFGTGKQKNYFHLYKGDTLNLKNMANDEVCKTGIVIDCQNQQVNLGKISCVP